MKKIMYLFLLILPVVLPACGNTSTTPGQTSRPSATAISNPTSKTAEQIIQQLAAAGLPVQEIYVFTAKNDTNHLLGRPGQYIGKASWSDSRIKSTSADGYYEVSDGGSVEVFASLANARSRFAYIQQISKSASTLAEYEYQQGLYILRLSKALTPIQAKAYQDAFKEAVSEGK
jgi:hypothetical protein